MGNLTDHTPSAIYPLLGNVWSAFISDNRLYLGGMKGLNIFEVTPSLTEPLIPVSKIPTKDTVSNILRVGDDSLLV